MKIKRTRKDIEKSFLEDISNYSDINFSNRIENEFNSKYNTYNFDTYIEILYNVKCLLITSDISQQEIINIIKSKIKLNLISA